ncbi:MAG: SIS domain-containing protein [archaeon]
MKKSDYNKICFCGIGGSGAPGEIVRALNLKKPVLVVREKLPASVNSKTLCFIVSYSGNTRETINLYNAAKKKKAKIVIITSGGKLAKKKEKVIQIPTGYMPRDAVHLLLQPALDVLGIKTRDILKIKNSISKWKAKRFAKKLKNKVPVVYASSEQYKVVSDRWKNQFNEDAKIFAHSGYFPEIAHNEIEERLGDKRKAILLLDKETKQIRKAKKFLKPVIIKLKGKSVLEKILYGIFFGDLVAFYLAGYKKVDYKLTKRIDWLKKK